MKTKMENKIKTYLVTGGAGFIGSNFISYILNKKFNIKIIMLDKLTYAAQLENLEEELKDERLTFIKGDICDKDLVERIFCENDIDYVVNFAAETHVDRSINNPRAFMETNIMGTQNLLEIARLNWTLSSKRTSSSNLKPLYKENKNFLQISTDEVYGDLKLEEEINWEENGISHKIYGKDLFLENSNLNPSSPYSSSKASADLIVLSYFKTYSMPVNISRCSNNYGPRQLEEKLIPLAIRNILDKKEVPIYGRGLNIRNWIYVEDHCECLDLILDLGESGEVYNIAGPSEEKNIEVVNTIIDILYKRKIINNKHDIISYVKDRLGHDFRYGLNCDKVKKKTNWKAKTDFKLGINKTLDSYLSR